MYNIAVESHGLWQLIENNLESGWRVLLKLTRISLIIVLYRPVCHFSGCWCWEKVENSESRVHWPRARIISTVQPSARARQTFIEKENKGIWSRNYAMIRQWCWQPLGWPVPALGWWPGLDWSQLPDPVPAMWADIKSDTGGVKINVNFELKHRYKLVPANTSERIE